MHEAPNSDPIGRAEAALADAATADDETRLKLLDELYDELEKELGLDEADPSRR